MGQKYQPGGIAKIGKLIFIVSLFMFLPFVIYAEFFSGSELGVFTVKEGPGLPESDFSITLVEGEEKRVGPVALYREMSPLSLIFHYRKTATHSLDLFDYRVRLINSDGFIIWESKGATHQSLDRGGGRNLGKGAFKIGSFPIEENGNYYFDAVLNNSGPLRGGYIAIRYGTIDLSPAIISGVVFLLFFSVSLLFADKKLQARKNDSEEKFGRGDYLIFGALTLALALIVASGIKGHLDYKQRKMAEYQIEKAKLEKADLKVLKGPPVSPFPEKPPSSTIEIFGQGILLVLWAGKNVLVGWLFFFSVKKWNDYKKRGTVHKKLKGKSGRKAEKNFMPATFGEWALSIAVMFVVGWSVSYVIVEYVFEGDALYEALKTLYEDFI